MKLELASLSLSPKSLRLRQVDNYISLVPVSHESYAYIFVRVP